MLNRTKRPEKRSNDIFESVSPKQVICEPTDSYRVNRINAAVHQKRTRRVLPYLCAVNGCFGIGAVLLICCSCTDSRSV